MKASTIIYTIPVIGYTGLWILGTVLFLVYFRILNVPMSSDHVLMIHKIPPILAISTVPLCSFVAFYLAARILLKTATSILSARERIRIAIISLVFTIAMDLLTTVLIDKMNILIFPINLMYVLGWAVIIPAVLLGTRHVSRTSSDK